MKLDDYIIEGLNENFMFFEEHYNGLKIDCHNSRDSIACNECKYYKNAISTYISR